MADETFDAVIVGGGTKALFLAMYLLKYGGMSVGIFEDRHELGGCLGTEEIAAPGFRSNVCATMTFPFYHLPLYRDFPGFWDYGAQWEQYLVADGAVFRNNNTCIALYSQKFDPTQERTAKEIARFSEKDADSWLRLWKLNESDEFRRVQLQRIFNPAEDYTDPKFGERELAFGVKLVESGFPMDSLIAATSHLRAARIYWESEELQHCVVRYCLSVNDVNELGSGIQTLMLASEIPGFGFNRGGTHQLAHAAHQILMQNGCKTFTHSEVKKVIIENGTAKGIRLADGSEIRARKIVVSTLNPKQLCFDLIGREYLDSRLARRVELLSTSFACLMWYGIAVHEAPKYKAAEFNPDINETLWLALAEDASPEHISMECKYQRLNMLPPLEHYCPTIWCHSLVDPLFAPPGKHIVQSEQLGPPATAYTEKEWMKIKKEYGENLITLFQRHCTNMGWDNIIGIDCNSPYDACRTKNLAPNGCWAVLDRSPDQGDADRPDRELRNHRTPIKNLYATGGAWFPGSNAGSFESYTCYKIIAKDLNLGKPWEEPGKEDPDSLVEQWNAVEKRVRDAAKPRIGYVAKAEA